MTDTNTKNLLLYGLQRSGSNYVESLVRKNFRDAVFLNDSIARPLPLHKHFRLYDDKYLIPHKKYMNCFFYKNFKDFDDHVSSISKRNCIHYIVVIKHPYAWYLSFLSHARRNNFDYFRKQVNHQFILDYNAFYSKWIHFFHEAGDRITIVKYEDLILDFNNCMDLIGKTTGLEKSSENYSNVKKIFMSKRFNRKRLMYYQTKDYHNKLEAKDKYIINGVLNRELLDFIGYELY